MDDINNKIIKAQQEYIELLKQKIKLLETKKLKK